MTPSPREGDLREAKAQESIGWSASITSSRPRTSSQREKSPEGGREVPGSRNLGWLPERLHPTRS